MNIQELIQCVFILIFGAFVGHALNIMTKPSEYDNETK